MRPQKNIYTIFCSNMYATHSRAESAWDPTKCNLEMVWRMFATLATGCRCFKSLMARCQWPWRMHHRSWQETLLQLQPDVFKYNVCHQCLQKGITMATCSMFASRAAMSWFPSRCYCLHFSLVGMSECLRVAKNPWFVCRVFEQIDCKRTWSLSPWSSVHTPVP